MASSNQRLKGNNQVTLSFNMLTDALKGNFTGGIVTLTIDGKIATISWAILTHASTAQPLSGAIIPVPYRPDVNKYVMPYKTSTTDVRIGIQTDGKIEFSYTDAAGVDVLRTSVASGGSFSYKIP